MTQRSVPVLFMALALGCTGSFSLAQTTSTSGVQASTVNYRETVPAPLMAIPNAPGVIVAPGSVSQIRAAGGQVTIIYGDNSRPVYAPPCNNYPAYPVYAAPQNNYPSYGTSTYGSSVSISTPGFQDQNFRLFPWTTTVTTWGSNSGPGPCAPQYPRNSYPAYPTYVPGPSINGYRGAASGYNYNGGSMVGGGYVGTTGNYIAPPYAVSVRRR